MRRLAVLAAVLACGTFGASGSASASSGEWAWGFQTYDQLGDGIEGEAPCPIGYRCSSYPVSVHGLSNVKAIASGEFHSLALLSDGTVDAWGSNFDDALGRETEGEKTNVPVPVSGLSEVTAISAGVDFSLALLADGKVMAWGRNNEGQLGNGSTTKSSVPVEVSGLEHVKAISAGFSHSLALLENGTVMAWGANGQGQLGNESTSTSTVPVEVHGLSEVASISAGGFEKEEQSLALTKGGTVEAWGSGEYGQLGNGATTDSHVPVEVPGLTNVTAIAAGGKHSLAVLSNGSVMAWGWNSSGALGIGTNTGPEKCGETPEACSTKPVEVHGISTATQVSAGWFYSLVLLSNGTASTWGDNIYDELGNGSNVQQSDTPVTVANLTEITAIAAGGEGGFAMRAAESPPEYGRCLKIQKGRGKYTSSTCTVLTTGESYYEWYPGVVKPAFSMVKKEGSTGLVLETVGKEKVSCLNELAAGGEYTGPKTLANVVLVLTGCSTGSAPCTSAGSASGEMVSGALKGELGWESASLEKVGLKLTPASGTQVFPETTCGVASFGVRGSVIGKVAVNKMLLSATLTFAESGGKQQPEAFEGGVASVLERTFLETSTQLGLKLTGVQASEEPVEASTHA